MCSESDRKTRILQRFCTATVVAASLVWAWTASTAIEAQELSLAERLRNASRPKGESKNTPLSNPAANGLRPLGSPPTNSANKSIGQPANGFGTAPFDLSVLEPLFEATKPEEQENAPGLRQLAENSFLAGNQSHALQLMFGHMAADYEEATDSILAVKYSSLLKRPVWNVRFGVSMWVRNGGPEDIDPAPIPTDGDTRNPASGERRLGTLGPPVNRNSAAPSSNQNSVINNLAEALKGSGRAFQANAGSTNSRPSTPNGRIGRQDQDEQSPGEDDAPKTDTESVADELSGEAASSLAQITSIPSEDGSMLSEVANEELNRNLGLVAQVIAEEFGARYRRGDFGPLLIDVEPTEPVSSSPRAAFGLQASPSDPALSAKIPTPASAPESLRMWQPGIVYLGNAITKEILEQAKAADIDLVIHMEVVLKPGRNHAAQNISRVRLINVATGKSIGASKTMDSHEESQLKAKGMGGREYVNEKLENLLVILDRYAKVVDLPPLTPEVARRRLGSLLGSEPERSLRTLAEIRLYQKQQLLTPEEVEIAFDIVGGSDSLVLLHGPAAERTKMALKWADKQL